MSQGKFSSNKPFSQGVIHVANFMQAVRDAGYKDISHALAELVDNAFEAEASSVSISIESVDGEITIAIEDDGVGMAPSTMEIALQFGGTTRFNSRNGSGRYGVGLPNSGLSQAKRIEVISWRGRSSVWSTYLDLDEIVSGKKIAIPKPSRIRRFSDANESGTVIRWKKCDRVRFTNARTFQKTIRVALGRIFRKHLQAGKKITVCDMPVYAIDPLFTIPTDNGFSATQFGPELVYSVRVPENDVESSLVRVRFSELPIEQLHSLSNADKRSIGISKGAGVSVLRANREIDYGWFFMGKKRRENYDDWWRCEVSFEPELDELFGVTNTKQGIRPDERLAGILTPDIQQIALTLNGRVRRRYAEISRRLDTTSATNVAARRDHLLEPPTRSFEFGETFKKSHRSIAGLNYGVRFGKVSTSSFFVPQLHHRDLTVVLNENHPFYECIYANAVRLSSQDSKLLRHYLELILMAAARAECTLASGESGRIIGRMREEWGKVLATFLE